MQIVDAHGLPSRCSHVVPRLVCEPLDVVGNVARELHDCSAEILLRFNAGGGEPLIDEGCKYARVDLSQPDYRTCLVKRAAWFEHTLHQRRFRSREYIA